MRWYSNYVYKLLQLEATYHVLQSSIKLVSAATMLPLVAVQAVNELTTL